VREWLSRIGLIGLGLAVALVGLEVALQLGAAVVRITHASRGVAKDLDHFRILCVGDSNTYGVYLEPHESYPAELERALAKRRPSQPVEVVNLGTPGLNSSRLLREFPGILESLSPELVIVLVGANDTWTDPAAESAERPATLGGLLKKHSRVLRLFRLLRARGRADLEVAIGATQGDLEVADHWVRIGNRDFDLGITRAAGPVPDADARLVENLGRLHEMIAGSGARALFMTYPGRRDLYALANQLIQESARAHDLPLLDLTQIFREQCPRTECPTLLFADQHPNAEGYRLIAREVAAWILTQRRAPENAAP
jgi:lysophospholipase L1-like esterase